MKILKGQDLSAPKILLYGLAGVGKSTLANTLRKPIFIDFEGGLGAIGPDRTPQITDLDVFYECLVELYRKAKEGKREYDTIVIDSADWMVRKIVEKAAGIDANNLTETLNKSNGGYGNGAQVLMNHVRTKLLPTLVALNKQGYGICLVAHAEVKSLMDEDGVNTDRVAPKIDEKTMHVFVEWVDHVLYLKHVGDERYLVFESDANVLAKNRLGRTGEVKLSEVDLNKILENKKGDK